MDKIAVIDCGCQYTHQIAESVRRANVYSEIVPHKVSYRELENFKGLIISGGPDSVFEKGAPKCDKRIYEGDKPLLGICYGHQLIGLELGGEVGRPGKGEYGEGKIKILKDSPLFKDFIGKGTVWMSHGDSVIELPEDFETLVVSNEGIIAAMSHKEKLIYGLQFHPEVSNTENGDQIIKNFAVDICGAKQEWSTESYIDTAVKKIRDQVGDGDAIVFASGGVDSSVAALLTYKALGDSVRAIHIDNGFERKGEAEMVKKILGDAGIDVEVLDKTDYTIKRVGRTLKPEKKRHILGDTFIEALYDEISDFEDDDNAYLVQGTIYPDSIESGEGVGKSAAVIKSHHNVASDMVKKLKKKGRVVEPNILLFKYETREVGRLLGLPPEISERHPFPGPGLGVRYVGRVLKPKNYEQTCESASGLLEEYELEGIMVPVPNVGVKGSDRAYALLALIYGDKGEYDKIRESSNRLGNEIKGITRATMLLDGKKYTQEEWSDISRMHVTRERLNILREADYIAMENLKRHDLYKNISQMPVVLFPGPERKPWIAIRPVVTPDFMTLRPPKIPGEMTWEYFDETVEKIMELPVGGVVLDTTSKPPGTTEWE